jgi:hypothetical protein
VDKHPPCVDKFDFSKPVFGLAVRSFHLIRKAVVTKEMCFVCFQNKKQRTKNLIQIFLPQQWYQLIVSHLRILWQSVHLSLFFNRIVFRTSTINISP